MYYSFESTVGCVSGHVHKHVIFQQMLKYPHSRYIDRSLILFLQCTFFCFVKKREIYPECEIVDRVTRIEPC